MISSKQLAQRLLRLSLAATLLASAVLPARAQEAGLGTIYAPVWPDRILVLDEASGEIQDTIQLRQGAAMSLEVSPDRTRFYANTAQMEGVEVIDIATGRVTDAFGLSEGNRRVRIVRRFTPHPDNNRLFAVVRVSVKEIDRYQIEPPQLITIDIAQRRVTRSLELPREYSGGQSPLMRVSPDGKYLYYLYRDFLVIDIESFQIVDKVELRGPLYPGAGAIRLGRSFETYDDPGSMTFVTTSTDPTTDQNVTGIARFDFSDQSIDYFEAMPGTGLGGFAVSPDHKRAYGVHNAIDDHEFYIFDLEERKMIRRVSYDGRPRTSLKVSSDGSTVYVHHAGNTIDYHDAETMAFEKRVELPGDSTAHIIIVPGR